jgi:glycosyltransferase involved in cell wall biosynthesis
MARITIVTGAHLCRNPRVVKEADALARYGHDVTVLGPVFTDELAATDAALLAGRHWRHLPTVDIRTRAGTLDRLRRRAGIEAVKRLGVTSPDALGYGLRSALRLARRQRPDLVIGHQEVGLWVAAQMHRDGFRVGIDFEDWYSEDLRPEDRVGRPVALLARLEWEMTREAAFTVTTSDALGEALAEAAETDRLPGTVYNAFPWADRDTLDGKLRDRADRQRPSLHWVSQTLGAGRGLDTVFAALRRVPTPVDLHLRGRAGPDDCQWLESEFPADVGHRLFVHGLVPPGELLSRISEHDIGIAPELRTPPSRDLTVTNKILHYLLGGLAVVATATQGQAEIARLAPEAVRLCEEGDAEGLAAQLRYLVEAPGGLVRAREAAWEAARQRFSWEQQEPLLLEAVEAALVKPPWH